MSFVTHIFHSRALSQWWSVSKNDIYICTVIQRELLHIKLLLFFRLTFFISLTLFIEPGRYIGWLTLSVDSGLSPICRDLHSCCRIFTDLNFFLTEHNAKKKKRNKRCLGLMVESGSLRRKGGKNTDSTTCAQGGTSPQKLMIYL